MSMVMLVTGKATMGRIQMDKDGNVVQEIPAKFEEQDGGPCVAVIEEDSETGEKNASGIFGDWDAAGYLKMALEMLKPERELNIPGFREITMEAMRDGVDLCDYCGKPNCMDCVVKEWKENLR